MKILEQKQLNLLVHLAKIDGQFSQSEHELLLDFIKKKGLTESDLEESTDSTKFSEFAQSDTKTELLYWAIKVMFADTVIHPKEVLFCKNLAKKLGYKEEVIDYYATKNKLSSLSEFLEEIKKYLITEIK